MHTIITIYITAVNLVVLYLLADWYNEYRQGTGHGLEYVCGRFLGRLIAWYGVTRYDMAMMEWLVRNINERVEWDTVAGRWGVE